MKDTWFNGKWRTHKDAEALRSAMVFGYKADVIKLYIEDENGNIIRNPKYKEVDMRRGR